MRNAEPFWPARLAAGAALLLYLTLPHALIMERKGLVPAVEGVLLAGLAITTPRRYHHQPSRLRAVIVGLLVPVSLTTLVSLILLARFLLDGSHARGQRPAVRRRRPLADQRPGVRDLDWGPPTQLDTSGPGRRLTGDTRSMTSDFLFRQMTQPQLAAGWRPGFVDYLYTYYTNATAFSRTDTLPLSAVAKLLMAIHSRSRRWSRSCSWWPVR